MGQYQLCDDLEVNAQLMSNGNRCPMDLMSTSLRSVDIKSIGHRFPLDINCGSPPNRRTTDIVTEQPVDNHLRVGLR